jgi:cyclophilin family peptidyl-prolyl cis-trans isomerase
MTFPKRTCLQCTVKYVKKVIRNNRPGFTVSCPSDFTNNSNVVVPYLLYIYQYRYKLKTNECCINTGAIKKKSKKSKRKMKSQSNLSISSPTKMKKDTSLRHSVSCNASSVKSQQQQRLYIAPQSTIRAPDADTTIALLQIDTNARRRRQNGNHNSIDLGTLTTFHSTTYSPQSSPSEKSSARYGSTSKNKKSRMTTPRRTTTHCHNSDNSSSDDDSILGNIETPCLWMDGVEGNIIPAQFSNGGKNNTLDFTQSWSAGGRSHHTSANGAESRYRKQKLSTKSMRLKFSSSGSVKSESKYNHRNGYADDGSVHTLNTIHSLQHEVQSKLTVDLGTPDRDDSSRFFHTKRGDRKTLIQQRHRMTSNGLGSNHSGDKNRYTRYGLIIAQGIIVILFIFILYDSRRRNIQHQQQLAMLDEERAHILEQMTWIDNAAKKVRKKYSSGYDSTMLLQPVQSNNGNVKSKSKEAQHNTDENKMLQSKIDMLQLRVQQNARTRTSIQFGDEPVQVSLPISEGDVRNEHFVIALSDDAPHAVNTFLQQVSIGLWNEIDFQQIQNRRVIQASTRHSDMKPILEFVEKSRGCHKAGSVALHQLESDDFHVTVLKIHMDASATVDTDDVCIGNVVNGFDLLERIQSQIPEIQSRNIAINEKD